MLNLLREKLEDAQGRSESTVIVFCDIRSFSQFSREHESPDIAMFIKRFYSLLLNDYFVNAVFAKPTGDGLLIVYRYDDKTLLTVSQEVFSQCFKVIQDFHSMFSNDLMINFKTPAYCGFGVSRGPSCCLYSGSMILDYSGQLLNLAARLNDYARPFGIVVDGNYQTAALPKDLAGRFEQKEVVLKGISEDKPYPILVSKQQVVIPESAKLPLRHSAIRNHKTVFTHAQLKKLPGVYALKVPKIVGSSKITKLTLIWPNRRMKGFIRGSEFAEFEFKKGAPYSSLVFDMSKVLDLLKDENLAASSRVTFQVEYSVVRK